MSSLKNLPKKYRAANKLMPKESYEGSSLKSPNESEHEAREEMYEEYPDMPKSPQDVKGSKLTPNKIYNSGATLGERPEMLDILDKKHEEAFKKIKAEIALKNAMPKKQVKK